VLSDRANAQRHSRNALYSAVFERRLAPRMESSAPHHLHTAAQPSRRAPASWPAMRQTWSARRPPTSSSTTGAGTCRLSRGELRVRAALLPGDTLPARSTAALLLVAELVAGCASNSCSLAQSLSNSFCPWVSLRSAPACCMGRHTCPTCPALTHLTCLGSGLVPQHALVWTVPLPSPAHPRAHSYPLECKPLHPHGTCTHTK